MADVLFEIEVGGHFEVFVEDVGFFEPVEFPAANPALGVILFGCCGDDVVSKSRNRSITFARCTVGHHGIEVCIDERGFVWVMLHSGSRGTGNQIGQYFIEQARRMLETRVLGYRVPDQDLAFFVEGESMFDDYIEAVSWAQDYARANREAMMERTLQAMRGDLIARQRLRLDKKIAATR